MVDTRILLASLATVLLAASVLATPGRAEQVSNGGAEVPARKLPVPERKLALKAQSAIFLGSPNASR